MPYFQRARNSYNVKENNPQWKDGRSGRKGICIDCSNKTSSYRYKRCIKCSNKGINHSQYGKVRLNKKPNNYCIDCNEVINHGYKRCHSCACKCLWTKDEYRNKNPRYLEFNSNWKGGISFEPYPLGWNKTYKEQIRFRDGYKCQICGKPEIENIRKLDVHHIDYNKKNLDLNNLISLCISCHIKTNYNRNYWEEYLRALLSTS